MGTWGHEYDQNDDAADFLDDVADARDWELISNRLDAYVSAGGYEDAQQTVAALEIVATALGRPPEDMRPDLAAWASEQRENASRLLPRAFEAVDLVIAKSELSELWNESVVDPDDRSGWQASMESLSERLRS